MFKYVFSIILIIYSYNINASLNNDINAGFNAAYGLNLYDKDNNNNNNVTSNQQNYGFFTDAYLSGKIQNNLNDEEAFGAVISVKTTTNNNAQQLRSYIYYINSYGRIELGSNHNVAEQLNIEAEKIVKSYIWQKFVYNFYKPFSVAEASIFFPDIRYMNQEFRRTSLTNQTLINSELAKKISYINNQMEGFEFGVSYTREQNNIGFTKNNSVLESKTYQVDDLFSFAARISGVIGNNINCQFSASIEHGKVDVSNDINKNVNNLSSSFTRIGLGGILNSGSLSYVMSYSQENSVISQGDEEDRIYSINNAISYEQGPVGASLGLFVNNILGNKLSTISFSSDYEISKGLKSYFELSRYFAHTKYDDMNNNKGLLFILGLKVSG